MHPKLLTIGTSEEALRALQKALIKAWDTIPNRIFKECLESILRRVKALIKAEG